MQGLGPIRGADESGSWMSDGPCVICPIDAPVGVDNQELPSTQSISITRAWFTFPHCPEGPKWSLSGWLLGGGTMVSSFLSAQAKALCPR